MSKPIILAVDDEQHVLRAIRRDLLARYGRAGGGVRIAGSRRLPAVHALKQFFLSRAASAVGEGSVAVHFIHRCLAAL